MQVDRLADHHHPPSSPGEIYKNVPTKTVWGLAARGRMCQVTQLSREARQFPLPGQIGRQTDRYASEADDARVELYIIQHHWQDLSDDVRKCAPEMYC